MIRHNQQLLVLVVFLAIGLSGCWNIIKENLHDETQITTIVPLLEVSVKILDIESEDEKHVYFWDQNREGLGIKWYTSSHTTATQRTNNYDVMLNCGTTSGITRMNYDMEPCQDWDYQIWTFNLNSTTFAMSCGNEILLTAALSDFCTISEEGKVFQGDDVKNVAFYYLQGEYFQTVGTQCWVGLQKSYRGFKNTTKTGTPCQKWTSHSPHKHTTITPSKYPNAGLEEGYCRNPNNEQGGVWCYTTDKNIKWDYCGVPHCAIDPTTFYNDNTRARAELLSLIQNTELVDEEKSEIFANITAKNYTYTSNAIKYVAELTSQLTQTATRNSAITSNIVTSVSNFMDRLYDYQQKQDIAEYMMKIQDAIMNISMDSTEEMLNSTNINLIKTNNTITTLPSANERLYVETGETAIVIYENDKLFVVDDTSAADSRVYQINGEDSGNNTVELLTEITSETSKHSDWVITNDSGEQFIKIPVCNQYNRITRTWDSENCETIHNDKTGREVVCLCNATKFGSAGSSFAVLMESKSIDPTYSKYQVILTEILLVASIVCLLVTIITLLILNRERKQKRRATNITICFCVALVVGYTLFFLQDLLVDTTYDLGFIKLNTAPCQLYTLAQHYVWLVIFTWMLLEGLFTMFVLINVWDTRIKCYFLKFNLIAWGVPLIFPIVGIFCFQKVIGEQVLKTTTYGPKKVSSYFSGYRCFLESGTLAYYLLYISPILLIIVINIFILLVGMKILILKRKTTNSAPSRRDSVKGKAKTVAALSAILGTGWIIGVLLLIPTNNTVQTVLQFLFIIINASQGIFVFLFHVLLNPQTRRKLMHNTSSTTTDFKLLQSN